MSRHRSAGSYGHAISRVAADHYRLSWTVDFYYSSSRLRHPRSSNRDTDEAGARRFAARWGINFDPDAKVCR